MNAGWGPRLLVAAMTLTLGAHLTDTQAQNAAGKIVSVKTPSGVLRGSEEDGLRRFLGVPYAQPPVGDLRWRPPQPLTPWTGSRDALAFGAQCMQGRRGPDPVALSEDCLFLNVWIPTQHVSRRLPVMVWVHGGAFVAGAGSQPLYEGSSLARQGIIVVTINYRLGAFGFLAHPALTRENPDGPLGNYGLMDVVEALKWVKANIKSLGGDPRKVTLAGQSAGGAAVYDLMTSPLSKGLFSKAIIESGVLSTPSVPMVQAEQSGAAAAMAWDPTAKDAAALRRLSAAQIQGAPAAAGVNFGPMIDGKVLPEDVAQAFDDGQEVQVPLLVGSNSYEAGFFPGTAKGLAQRMGSVWPRVTAVYDGYGTDKTDQIELQLTTDILLTAPTRQAARAAASHGSPTFLYHYSYVRPSRRDAVPGASHIDEVYALFGHMNLMAGGTPDAPDGLPIVAAVQERWSRFIKTGSPATKTEPWPALDLERQQLLEFTNAGEIVRTDFAAQRLDLAAALPKVAPLR